MSEASSTRTVAGGFLLPECPRWHEDALWLVDMLRGTVLRIAGDLVEPIARFDRPSAVGFRPNGDLIVVDGTRRVVHTLRRGVVVESLDLSALTSHLNDMVLDRHGWAYIDSFGTVNGAGVGAWTGEGCIILITFESPPRVVAENLVAPNGIGISPDGGTLVVGTAVNGSDRRGAELVSYDIGADGSLSGHRVVGEISRGLGDGLCFDSEGGVWVGTAWGHEAQRFLDGEVVERIRFDRKWALACALGGPDLRTLFVCTTAPPTGGDPSKFTEGWVEAVEVRVRGFAT